MTAADINTDGQLYTWSQTPDQITIVFTVPKSFTSKQINITFTPTTLHCRIFPNDKLMVSGKLYGSIQSNECIWQVEDIGPKKLLTIHLEKVVASEWPIMIIPDDVIDMDVQVKYITSSAEKGLVLAMLRLAAWYELGEEENSNFPVARDPLSAHEWHSKAAEHGNAEACFIVSTAYTHATHGCTKDYVLARKWMLKCLETENLLDKLPVVYINCNFQLGLLHMEGGNGLGDPNPLEAAGFWKNSAQVGHPESIYNLGVFHLNGFGIEVNIPGGIKMIEMGIHLNPKLDYPVPLTGMTDEQIRRFSAISITQPKDESMTQQAYLALLAQKVKNEEPVDKIVGSEEKETRKKPKNPKISKKDRKMKRKIRKIKASEDATTILIGLGIVAAVVSIGFYVWKRNQ